MIKLIERYPILSILFFSSITMLPNLDSLVVSIMESRNFITAREMVYDGNWLLTTMNGVARYQKPPLPTWLTALSGMLFGMNNLLALRLPSALMIGFSGVFMYLISKKITLSHTLSTSIAFIFITSFYIIVIVIEAPWDLFAHGFMLAGIYFLINLFQDRNNIWKNTLLAGFFVGLSIMSKGPVSLYVLFLPFIIAYSIIYKYKIKKSKQLAFLFFILVSLSIGGWWFLYIRKFDPLVFEKITSRETSNWTSYNVRPFYYYWNFFIQSGIWTILASISLMYPYLIRRIHNKKFYQFSFFWTIISVVLLSIIPEKKPRYLVPVLFPLAMITGVYIDYLINNFKNIRKYEKFLIYFNFGLFSVLGLLIPIIFIVLSEFQIKGIYLKYIFFLTTFLLTVSFYIIKSLKQQSIKNAFYGMVFFMGSLLLFGIPLSKAFYKNQQFKSMNLITKTIEKKYNIKSYTYKDLSPELIWSYGKNIEILYSLEEISRIPNNRFGILIGEKDRFILKELPKSYRYEFVDKFDMNYDLKDKNRLIRNYYIITKKSNFE